MYSIRIAIFILLGLGAAFGSETPHKYYVDRNVCALIETSKYDMYFSRVKLKCDWNKFIDANISHEPSARNQDDPGYVYEFEFVPSAIPSENQKYQVVHGNLFKSFIIKSLSLRNLGLKSIDSDAFSSDCCEKTLETLDLSHNGLVRIDASLLSGLKRLEKLVLSNNSLSFSERNFENNKNLRHLDLSSNKLQYLPSHLLYNLHELDSINLSNNNFKSIDACTFNHIQKSLVARNFYPANINLQGNPIECDCNIFYLNRHLNYKINVTCNKPEFYSGKSLYQLVDEDPSSRCQYSKMAKKCNAGSTTSIDLIAIVILASLLAVFLILVICCCCRNVTLSGKIKKLKKQISDAQKPPAPPKPIYVDSGVNNNNNNVNPNNQAANNDDKEKLLA